MQQVAGWGIRERGGEKSQIGVGLQEFRRSEGVVGEEAVVGEGEEVDEGVEEDVGRGEVFEDG